MSPSRKLRRARAVSASLLSDSWEISYQVHTMLGGIDTYFRFMAQTGNLAPFDLNEQTIVYDRLYAALDLLAFLEVR